MSLERRQKVTFWRIFLLVLKKSDLYKINTPMKTEYSPVSKIEKETRLFRRHLWQVHSESSSAWGVAQIVYCYTSCWHGSRIPGLGWEAAGLGKANLSFKFSVIWEKAGRVIQPLLLPLTTLFMMLMLQTGRSATVFFVCASQGEFRVCRWEQKHEQRSGWMAGREGGTGKYTCKEYIYKRWWYLTWEGKRQCCLVGVEISYHS